MIPDFVWEGLKQLIPLTGLAAPIAEVQTWLEVPPPVEVIADNMTMNVETTGSQVARLRLFTSPTPLFYDYIAVGALTNVTQSGADFAAFTQSAQNPQPFNSLRISQAGYVGFGTGLPLAKLDILCQAQTGAEALARFSLRTDFADQLNDRLQFSNASANAGVFIPRLQGVVRREHPAITFDGQITTDSGINPVIACNPARSAGGQVTRPLAVYRNNATDMVRINANGDVFASSFNPVSSRALKHDIANLDSLEAAAAVRDLTPVTFVYKDDATAKQRIGFIAEDVPEIVANPDRKSVPVMDVVALVTRVVKDQHQGLDQMKNTIEGNQERLETQMESTQQQIKSVELTQKLIDDQKKSIDQQTADIDELLKRLDALESQSQK